ncbi:MAG: ATPase, T2SS/T4P/T4SS family [Clostridiales bacterium]|nr:ATPase, T2SS/T4P/T4SS family [Clostridiales bacterium]
MPDGNVFSALYEAQMANGGVAAGMEEEQLQKYQSDANAPKSYEDVLAVVQKDISQNHATELADSITKTEGQKILKSLIARYINSNNIVCAQISDYNELTEKIFDDMAGFSFLTPYIYNDDVEEININSYDDIEVIDSACGGKEYRKLEEHFASPQQCQDIVAKMCRLGGIVIDGSQPVKDSYIFQGTRISAMVPPIVDAAVGAVASIRRQKSSKITKEMFLKYDTATEDELDFVVTCINNGISIVLGGATGSGKTADLGYVLDNIDDSKRVYIMEEARELDVTKRDDNGRVVNRVLYTKTRTTNDPKTSVTPEMLLKQALRQHPDIIVPAEMRGAEAWTAQESGRTGHTIATTVHCNSAEEAYKRILTMCLETGTKLSENMLMGMIMDAFPIVVFKKQLKDGSRKYMRIIEPTDYVDGHLKYNVLYEYKVHGWTKDEYGNLKVSGEHKKIMPLSDKLATRMLENGAEIETIRRYASPKWYASVK